MPRGLKAPVLCLCIAPWQQVPVCTLKRRRASPLDCPWTAMPNLQRLRTLAFCAQAGRCFYCGLPMWNRSTDELKAFGLRARTAAPLRCTAEHLVAQQDGGKDAAGNIAAACWLCNTRRHKRKTPPPPEVYRAFVQKRLARGKWHPPAVARLKTARAPAAAGPAAVAGLVVAAPVAGPSPAD